MSRSVVYTVLRTIERNALELKTKSEAFMRYQYTLDPRAEWERRCQATAQMLAVEALQPILSLAVTFMRNRDSTAGATNRETPQSRVLVVWYSVCPAPYDIDEGQRIHVAVIFLE
ncbi:hypothetical protein CLCR_03763 [Cladophialophora carrionii]|uniref:Uncharacterized protein n=1 Tax=Cladophialophora carrionii TaxID=86049 RepID=A0A1C1CGK3_9EURO|nr:hypothetical protein CLCR_03763 [Cladophialophora carrionii]